MKRGIYTGISNADYHAESPPYSSSLIKLMHTPARAKWALDNPPEYKDCFRIGSAIHKWILEPADFESEFLTGIDAPRRSKADKAAWSQWFTDHGAIGDQIIELPAGDWNKEFERQSGKHMVKPDEIEEIKLMAQSVACNDLAIQLLENGEAEQSVYWTDDDTGLQLRCRPDYMSDDFICELKSIGLIDKHVIQRTISDRGYGISQVMYQHGVYAATGKWKPFTFIFIEKEPPYMCKVISLNEVPQEHYWNKYKTYLNRLAECLDSNAWPGIDNDLDFNMPDWSFT